MPNFDKQATQCPHCQMAFTVTQEQLSINTGNVRCGACLQTFPALVHRVQIVETNSDDYNEHDQFELIGLISDEYDQHDQFERVDFNCEKSDEQDQTTLIDLVEKAVTVNAHDDNPEILGHLRKFDCARFPIINQKEQNTSSIECDQLTDDNKQSANEVFTIGEIKSTPLYSHTNHSQSKPSFNNNLANITIEPETIQLQLDKKKPSRSRWGLAATLIISLLALGLPYSWNHYPQLITDLKLKSFLEQLCLVAHCKVPALQDSHQLHKKGVLIEPHPTAVDSFRLTMMIINKATFEQPWPYLSVEFSNLQEKPIFWHTVTPSAYLGGELVNVDRMPSNHPIYITVDFAKASDQPLGYQVELVHR